MTIAKPLTRLLAEPLLALLEPGISKRLQLATIEERSRFVAETPVTGLAVGWRLVSGWASGRPARTRSSQPEPAAPEEVARLAQKY